MSAFTTYIIIGVIKSAVVLFVLLTAVAYTVWLERKLIGRMQNRWGPTRVGPFGLLQPLADGLKFILKEDLTPPYVYKSLYLLAPMMAVALGLLSIAIIPIGPNVQIGNLSIPLQITGALNTTGQPSDISVGLLLIFGITSVGVYAIALSGWSSNSKYSLLGSLRASAQMVSYEIALGLSVVGVILLTGSLSLRDVVNAQSGGWAGISHWNIWPGAAGHWGNWQFFAFFIYLMAAFAETNRVPFDLPEAETELVAGYHTEYSAMKFAMFFMAEYANMFTVACLATVLFLGGWNGPMFGPPLLHQLLPVVWFAVKVGFFIFLYIWIRGTVPRFRYDQLMGFGWKVLLPLAIANIVVTSLVVALK